MKAIILKANELKKELFENILFLSFASTGAMGRPGTIEFMTRDGKLYSLNYLYEINLEDVLKYFPVLKEFRSENETVDGWNFVPLGFGNHLIVKDDVYPQFSEETKDYEKPSQIYASWKNIAKCITETLETPEKPFMKHLLADAFDSEPDDSDDIIDCFPPGFIEYMLFDEKIEKADSPKELATLAEEVFEMLLNEEIYISTAKQHLSVLLSKGLDPNISPDDDEDGSCIDDLIYLHDEEALKIAQMIFEKSCVPAEVFASIGTHIDRYSFNNPYLVKLYLLASAYIWKEEETYIKMNENLYEEMFDSCYDSFLNGYTKLNLTPEIFKDIDLFDFAVEMLPQEIGTFNKVIHIFDKASKIEVARYE